MKNDVLPLYNEIMQLADDIQPIYEHVVNAETIIDEISHVYASHIKTYHQLYRGIVLDPNYLQQQIIEHERQNLGVSYTKDITTATLFADDNWTSHHVKCIVTVELALAVCVKSILSYYTDIMCNLKNELEPWVQLIEQDESILDPDSIYFIDCCTTLLEDIKQQLDHALCYADRENELIILQDIYPTCIRNASATEYGLSEYTFIEAVTKSEIPKNMLVRN